MNINDKLEQWLIDAENENLEFKEAKTNYNSEEALRYCVALANEGGGYLVLGVSDTLPRQVTGTKAFLPKQLNELKARAVDELHIRIQGHEISHPDGRVLALEIPAHPAGKPLNFKGRYLMRVGGSLMTMTSDRLREILTENRESWLKQLAVEQVTAEEAITLLNVETYFNLLKQPHPTTPTKVLECLAKEGLAAKQGNKWNIANMGAILLARNLGEFPSNLARKGPRFIIYEGNSKLVTTRDRQSTLGYAVGFENLIQSVYESAPQNRLIEETIREEYKMFPWQALRELIANALIHQDFSISGGSVMIEMYSDRVEISNPGRPIIDVNRFIDGYLSRNEQFTDIMRRFGFCEEKGSGIDKVIDSVEVSQLPAPDFRGDDIRTTVALFAPIKFSKMSKEDRIRACYQHCCLRYVFNKRMTNTSLRKRFDLTTTQMGSISQLISHTKEAELVKIDASRESFSPRHARYVPWWA